MNLFRNRKVESNVYCSKSDECEAKHAIELFLSKIYTWRRFLQRMPEIFAFSQRMNVRASIYQIFEDFIIGK